LFINDKSVDIREAAYTVLKMYRHLYEEFADSANLTKSVRDLRDCHRLVKFNGWQFL